MRLYFEVLQVTPAGAYLHFGLQLDVEFNGRLHLPLDDLSNLTETHQQSGLQLSARTFVSQKPPPPTLLTYLDDIIFWGFIDELVVQLQNKVAPSELRGHSPALTVACSTKVI